MILILTDYQASVVNAALMLFREENEIAIGHANEINSNKADTNDFLTCINATEEAGMLHEKIVTLFLENK